MKRTPENFLEIMTPVLNKKEKGVDLPIGRWYPVLSFILLRAWVYLTPWRCLRGKFACRRRREVSLTSFSFV